MIKSIRASLLYGYFAQTTRYSSLNLRQQSYDETFSLDPYEAITHHALSCRLKSNFCTIDKNAEKISGLKQQSEMTFERENTLQNFEKNINVYLREYPYALIPVDLPNRISELKQENQILAKRLLIMDYCSQEKNQKVYLEMLKLYKLLFPISFKKKAIVQFNQFQSKLEDYVDNFLEEIIKNVQDSNQKYQTKLENFNFLSHVLITEKYKQLIKRIDQKIYLKLDSYGIGIAFAISIYFRLEMPLTSMLNLLQKCIKHNKAAFIDRNYIIFKILFNNKYSKKVYVIRSTNKTLLSELLYSCRHQILRCKGWQKVSVMRKLAIFWDSSTGALAKLIQEQIISSDLKKLQVQYVSGYLRLKNNLKQPVKEPLINLFFKNVDLTRRCLLSKKPFQFLRLFSEYKTKKKMLPLEMQSLMKEYILTFISKIQTQSWSIIQLSDYYPIIARQLNLFETKDLLRVEQVIHTNYKTKYTNQIIDAMSTLYQELLDRSETEKSKEEDGKLKIHFVEICEYLFKECCEVTHDNQLIVKTQFRKVCRVLNHIFHFRLEKYLSRIPKLLQFKLPPVSVQETKSALFFSEDIESYMYLILQLKESKLQKVNSLNNVEPYLLHYLSHQKLTSMATIYLILKALYNIQYDSKMLYLALEINLRKILRVNIRYNPQFYVNQSKLRMIKMHMTDLHCGTQSLLIWVTNSLSNQNNTKEFLKTYVTFDDNLREEFNELMFKQKEQN